jgi:hypothetical protein
MLDNEMGHGGVTYHAAKRVLDRPTPTKTLCLQNRMQLRSRVGVFTGFETESITSGSTLPTVEPLC